MLQGKRQNSKRTVIIYVSPPSTFLRLGIQPWNIHRDWRPQTTGVSCASRPLVICWRDKDKCNQKVRWSEPSLFFHHFGVLGVHACPVQRVPFQSKFVSPLIGTERMFKYMFQGAEQQIVIKPPFLKMVRVKMEGNFLKDYRKHLDSLFLVDPIQF